KASGADKQKLRAAIDRLRGGEKVQSENAEDQRQALEKYTIDNYDPSNYDDIGDIRGPVPVCVKITPEGKITRQSLQKNEDWCYYPGYGVKLKNGAQMMAVRVMKDQFIITVFKVKG
ncbi:MAG TPA: hypothetical protein PLC65_02065, partial [Bacteroidia bacterium]|nr:hypothetical protein [Bacteroidia bacterium]